jgi:hypothetical protein
VTQPFGAVVNSVLESWSPDSRFLLFSACRGHSSPHALKTTSHDVPAANSSNAFDAETAAFVLVEHKEHTT